MVINISIWKKSFLLDMSIFRILDSMSLVLASGFWFLDFGFSFSGPRSWNPVASVNITKCDNNLLQRVTGITKYDTYYKVWQKIIIKCDRSFKVW